MVADRFLLPSLFLFCYFYTRCFLSWTHSLVLLPEGIISATLADCIQSQEFILAEISGKCIQIQRFLLVLRQSSCIMHVLIVRSAVGNVMCNQKLYLLKYFQSWLYHSVCLVLLYCFVFLPAVNDNVENEHYPHHFWSVLGMPRKGKWNASEPEAWVSYGFSQYCKKYNKKSLSPVKLRAFGFCIHISMYTGGTLSSFIPVISKDIKQDLGPVASWI